DTAPMTAHTAALAAEHVIARCMASLQCIRCTTSVSTVGPPSGTRASAALETGETARCTMKACACDTGSARSAGAFACSAILLLLLPPTTPDADSLRERGAASAATGQSLRRQAARAVSQSCGVDVSVWHHAPIRPLTGRSVESQSVASAP